MTSKVAFIDNGVIQRKYKCDSLKGKPLLNALSQHYGGQTGREISIAFSPLFWVELSGNREIAMQKMDEMCQKLVPLEDAKKIYEWFLDSINIILKDTDDLGNLLNQEVASGLQKQINGFIPELGTRLAKMWTDFQKDGGYHRALLKHLAVDRLAVKLSRKNCKPLRNKDLRAGKIIMEMATDLAEAFPEISPYRLLLPVWETYYYRNRLKEIFSFNLKEKSDLLDGDLVTRSVLKLDSRFESLLILTSDQLADFTGRRKHLVDACSDMNRRIQAGCFGENRFKKFELIDSTVCFFSKDTNENTYEFREMTSNA